MTWAAQKTVVVPVDFSEPSYAAVDLALEMGAAPERVYVVHVLSELSPSDVNHVMAALDVAGRRRHAEDLIRQRLAEPRYASMTIQVRIGDPGQEIVALAESLPADLIVMPSHGRTGWNRLLVGSVAERVVRLAHCPVLILRN